MELRKISQEELNEILKLHKKWLNNEEGGVKANLYNADLRGAYLRYADLYEANLSFADLRYANLYEANLSYADLSNTDLSNADLSYVDFDKTKFYLTNLYKAKGEFVNVGDIGSRNDTTHYFYNDDRIICGCFDGTMKEFEDRVKETYEEEDREYKEYMIAIRTLKELGKLELEFED